MNARLCTQSKAARLTALADSLAITSRHHALLSAVRPGGVAVSSVYVMRPEHDHDAREWRAVFRAPKPRVASSLRETPTEINAI